MTDAEAVTAFDLEAYVDGQLDPGRRFEVEDHLSRHPEAAAQVMADMRARDAVRLLAAAPLDPPSAGQVEAAQRLRGGLRRAGRVRELARIAAALALVLAGVIAGRSLPGLGPDREASEFVAEAVQAHRASLVRAAINSVPEAAYYNPAEIRSATRIVLPPLPADWQVTDVQVFPSEDGPTVAMAVNTRTMGAVSLFAARAPEFADRDPEVAQAGRRAVAYWQIGHLAYALTGAADPRKIEAAAGRLSDALNERPGGASRIVRLSAPIDQ
jgi:anti-sigma factor RsiW